MYLNIVCKLDRYIYGLKQASHRQNIQFDDKIKDFGFLRNEDEQYVYVKTSRGSLIFPVLYVNDILLIGNDVPMLQSVKVCLEKCFTMKDMVDVAYILGIKIYGDRSR